MKRYVTTKSVMLSFILSRDQIDVSLAPGAVLECDGSTIWLLQDGKRHESITTANFIPIMLERGTIVEDLPIL